MSHIFALNLGLGIFFERSRSKDLTTDSGRLQKTAEEDTAGTAGLTTA